MTEPPVSAVCIDDEQILSALYGLLKKRGPDKSVCPSEVARALSTEQWRDFMSQVRTVGWSLAEQNIINVTQKGVQVKPGAHGPIRFSQGSYFLMQKRDN